MRPLPASLALVFVVGCAAGDVPPRTLSDPANPSAKEGVRFAVEASLADGTTADGGGHQHHDHGASTSEAGTLYTCPMHPEVVQDHPGSCPKCGMTLKAK